MLLPDPPRAPPAGLLPSIISMLWDTYVLPMAFYFASQAGFPASQLP